MKFYQDKEGVIVQSNESFFKALRYSLIVIALIIALVLSSNVMNAWRIFSFLLAGIVIVILLITRLVIQIDVANKRY